MDDLCGELGPNVVKKFKERFSFAKDNGNEMDRERNRGEGRGEKVILGYIT